MASFVCVFAGLALLHGLGPSYAKAHAAFADALVHSLHFSSGARLHFEALDVDLARKPWQITLYVEPRATLTQVAIPIDLRTLVYLPSAAYVALGIAAPLTSVRAHLRLLGVGLLILEPLLLLLVALPLLSFLGGTGPVSVFELGRGAHVALQVLYRALVAPPGMTYAIPLFIWWVLLAHQLPAALGVDPSSRVRSRSQP